MNKLALALALVLGLGVITKVAVNNSYAQEAPDNDPFGDPYDNDAEDAD